jgi:hypothetical protein
MHILEANILYQFLVKQSHYRPVQDLGTRGSWGYKNFYTVGILMWYPCQPAASTAQEISLVLISVRGWVDFWAVVRREGLSQWKIETATFGLQRSSSTTSPLIFFFTAARTCYLIEQKMFTRPDDCGAPEKFFVMCIIRIFTMKIEKKMHTAWQKFSVRGRISVTARPRTRAP